MKFNAKKCKILTVTRSKKPVNFYYNMNGLVLERVSHMRDLGVIVDSELSWTNQDLKLHLLLLKQTKCLMLRLHYVHVLHVLHVCLKRGQNGMNLMEPNGTWGDGKGKRDRT